MMKKLVTGLIVAAVLIAGGITVGTVISNQPEAVVKNTLKNTAQDLVDRKEFSSVLKMLEGGSLSVDADLENIAVEGKIYFQDLFTSGKEQMYVEDLTLETGDQKFNASAYFSNDLFYLTDCNIFDGIYGLVRGDLEHDFEKSVFVDNDLMEESELNSLRALLRFIDESKDVELRADAEKMLNKYAKKSMDIFFEHAELEEETDRIMVGGSRLESRVIVITVDEEALAAMVIDFYKTLASDKSMRKLVLEYGDDLLAIEGQELDVEKYYDEEILNEKAWNDFAAEIKKTDFEITVEIVTPKSSAVLRKLIVHLDTKQADEDVLVLDFGKNGVKKANLISAEINGITYTYEIVSNSGSKYEAFLNVDKEEFAHLTVDRKKDNYELVWGDLVMQGEFTESSDQTTISLDKVKNGSNTVSCDISITIDEKSEMPTPESKRDVTSLFKLTEEDLEKLYDIFKEVA